MEIQIDDLESAEVAQLLQVHHADLLRHSPPENVNPRYLCVESSRRYVLARLGRQ